EFLSDIYTMPDLGLQKYMEDNAARFKDEIVNFYKNGQASGDIRKEVNVDFIMTYSLQMTKLMEDESLMAQYKAPSDFILEIMNLLFYGIVAK
nr:hypothetical protein [Bacteroidota bacterium]